MNPGGDLSVFRGDHLVSDAQSAGRRAAALKNRPVNKAEDKKLRDTCSEMESLFVKQLLTAMRKTVNKSGLLDGGRAEEIFTDMLDDRYASLMSKNRTFGFAEMLYGQLSGGRKW